MRQLVDRGLLAISDQLVGSHKGVDYHAVLTPLARIRIESGEEFESPSPAAMAVLGRQSWNGWMFWQVVNPDGSTMRFDDLRKQAMQQGALNEPVEAS